MAGTDWKPSLGTGEVRSTQNRADSIKQPLRSAAQVHFLHTGPRWATETKAPAGAVCPFKRERGKKHHLFRVFTVYSFYRALERELFFLQFPPKYKRAGEL